MADATREDAAGRRLVDRYSLREPRDLERAEARPRRCGGGALCNDRGRGNRRGSDQGV